MEGFHEDIYIYTHAVFCIVCTWICVLRFMLMSMSMTIYTSQCLCLCLYIYIYLSHQYMNIHIYIYTRMYVCMYVCTYVRMYVCMYVCMYVLSIYVHVYIYLYLSIYIYTYLHNTYTRKKQFRAWLDGQMLRQFPPGDFFIEIWVFRLISIVTCGFVHAWNTAVLGTLPIRGENALKMGILR